MRSKIIVLLSIAALYTASAVYAEEVTGTVSSVDLKNNQLTVAKTDGTTAKILVHGKVAQSVSKGSHVKAVVKSGSAKAETIEVEM